jgi:hypothetical protein
VLEIIEKPGTGSTTSDCPGSGRRCTSLAMSGLPALLGIAKANVAPASQTAGARWWIEHEAASRHECKRGLVGHGKACPSVVAHRKTVSSSPGVILSSVRVR